MKKYFSERPSYRLEEIFEEIGAIIDDLGPDEEDVAITAINKILAREALCKEDRNSYVLEFMKSTEYLLVNILVQITVQYWHWRAFSKINC